VADPTDTASRIELARDGLTAKLGELRRREASVRAVLSPIRHLANPWLRIGVAAVIGYRLGRPGPVRAAVETAPARSETLLGAIVRASLIVVAQAVVRRVVVELVAEDTDEIDAPRASPGISSVAVAGIKPVTGADRP
jgi:hypothetical protein